MFQRLLQAFQMREPTFTEELVLQHLVGRAEPAKIVQDDRFRMRVFEGNSHNCEHCGRPARWLIMDFRNDEGVWDELLPMHESCLLVMMNVLEEVSDFLGDYHDPTRLRTVTIGGKRYFIDERLMQLRNTEDPAEFVDIPHESPRETK